MRCIRLIHELRLNAITNNGIRLQQRLDSPPPQTSGPEVGNCAVFVTGSTIADSAQTPTVPKRLRFAWWLSERFDRIGLVIVDVKHGVELGQLKQVANLFGQLEELHVAALILGRRVGGH
jgi:hypothetical protein